MLIRKFVILLQPLHKKGTQPMSSILKYLKRQPGFAMVVNVLVLMAVYMLSRWVFYYMNVGNFPDVRMADMMRMSWGGMRFDLSALCYLNLLCIDRKSVV